MCSICRVCMEGYHFSPFTEQRINFWPKMLMNYIIYSNAYAHKNIGGIYASENFWCEKSEKEKKHIKQKQTLHENEMEWRFLEKKEKKLTRY